jgi:hypothetical protein
VITKFHTNILLIPRRMFFITAVCVRLFISGKKLVIKILKPILT